MVLNVWGGIRGGVLLGPVFYERSLNGQFYLEDILKGPVDEYRANRPLGDSVRLWFQHDGAPPYAHHEVQIWLHANFPKKWIGWGGHVSWSARSPDFMPLDFSLWGYINDRVYVAKTTTPDSLKEKIHDIYRNISSVVLRSASFSVVSRFQRCIADGDLFEQYI